MNTSKILWLDLETTGVEPGSAVVQIAGIIDVDREPVSEFSINARPHDGALISGEALRIIGKTREEIEGYQPPYEALTEFESILGRHCDKYDRSDKYVLAGHNCGFDFSQLTGFYERLGNRYLGSWMHYKWKFDTLAVIQALQVCGRIPVLQDNKLATVAEALGIQLEAAHDALADIRATRAIGYRLMERLT